MKKQILTVIAGACMLAGCANLCGVETKTCAHKKVDFTFDNTLFAFDSAELTNTAKTNLDKVVMAIQDSKKVAEVNGYTDITGDATYNMDLSQRRANAVADYLKSQGVCGKHLTVKGYGATHFVADNDTMAGRAKNRRVDIVLE